LYQILKFLLKKNSYLKFRLVQMKQFGSLEIPQEAFIGVPKINKDA
jgi:hypothetical protein